jgi:hypothetical protein
MNVTVTFARTAAEATPPESADTPEGTSIARTGLALSFIKVIAST